MNSIKPSLIGLQYIGKEFHLVFPRFNVSAILIQIKPQDIGSRLFQLEFKVEDISIRERLEYFLSKKNTFLYTNYVTKRNGDVQLLDHAYAENVDTGNAFKVSTIKTKLLDNPDDDDDIEPELEVTPPAPRPVSGVTRVVFQPDYSRNGDENGPDSEKSDDSYNGDEMKFIPDKEFESEIRELIARRSGGQVSFIINNNKKNIATFNLYNGNLVSVDPDGNKCIHVIFYDKSVEINNYYYEQHYGHQCWVDNDAFFAIIFLLARINRTPFISLTDGSKKYFKVGDDIVHLKKIPLSLKSYMSFYKRQGFHHKKAEKLIVKLARSVNSDKLDPEQTYGELARNVILRLRNDKTNLTSNDIRRIDRLNNLKISFGHSQYIANAAVDNNGFIATPNRIENVDGVDNIYVTVTNTDVSKSIAKGNERTKKAEANYALKFDLKGNSRGGTRKKR